MEYTDPVAARLAARTREYPGIQAERENIARVDQAVFEQVRNFETITNDSADHFVADVEVDATASIELSVLLRDEVTLAAQASDADTGALAIRLQQLRHNAENAIQRLQRAAEEAAWRAEKCETPMEGYQKLLATYEPLARNRAVQV